MRILVLLVLLIAGFQTKACMHALQNRIFPLGWCDKGWVVLETHLQRTFMKKDTSENSKVSTGWRGTAYYKIYKDANHIVSSKLLDSVKLFAAENYVEVLSTLFNKAMLLAKQQVSFQTATPVSLWFCDYTIKCSKVQLQFDTLQNKMWLQTENSKKHDVTVINNTSPIIENLFVDYYTFKDNGQLLVSQLAESINAGSVRVFKVGNKTLTLVHLGTGQRTPMAEDEYDMGKEYVSPFSFSEINKSVFEEPLLHHGRGFDFFFSE